MSIFQVAVTCTIYLNITEWVCVCMLRMNSATAGPFRTGPAWGLQTLPARFSSSWLPGKSGSHGPLRNEGGRGRGKISGQVAFPGMEARRAEGVRVGYRAGHHALTTDRGFVFQGCRAVRPVGTFIKGREDFPIPYLYFRGEGFQREGVGLLCL
jgi:hypothetical protein